MGMIVSYATVDHRYLMRRSKRDLDSWLRDYGKTYAWRELEARTKDDIVYEILRLRREAEAAAIAQAQLHSWSPWTHGLI